VTFVSLKGAPGVTTLVCLVGGSWPALRRVAVVEGDAAGGDLAARFALSASTGWSSYATERRRTDGVVVLAQHLQELPGGLEVLVRPEAGVQPAADAEVDGLLRSAAADADGPWDLLVDGGRLDPEGARTTGPWLDRSDRVIVVARRDPASMFRVAERTPALVERCGERVGLVAVGSGPQDRAAIERFTGLTVLGELPEDGAAARIVAGPGGGVRRLARSHLVASVRRLTTFLVEGGRPTDAGPGGSDRTVLAGLGRGREA
jgi:hypothetical protein